jgi:hypothetical protein
LATTERLTEVGWGNPDILKTYFTGEIHCLDVGIRHIEILDTENESFAHHMRQCVRSARAGVAANVPQKS